MAEPKIVKKGQKHIKEHWTKGEIKSELAPMIDPGTGKAMILRQFEFAFNPAVLEQIQQRKLIAPTKQDLFNHNWPQIRIMLWGDGLIANTDVEPRIVVGKKRYRIFILCEPRTKASGIKEVVADRPRNLTEILNPKN